MSNTPKVVVAGAGASGMMAAGRAAGSGVPVVLLEKGDSPGRKLLISGKSRCNLSNTADLEEFIAAFGTNGKFLYSVFHRFFRDDLVEFFRKSGVEVKAERGGRIFPVSDNASDVVTALSDFARQSGAEIRKRSLLKDVIIEDGKLKAVRTSDGEIPCCALVIATGGASYPSTGSTGDGFRIARKLGHNVTKLRPALVPLKVMEKELAASMQGVALKNIRLTAFSGLANGMDFSRLPDYDTWPGITGRKPGKGIIESRMGEMMFTHFGIGGPVTLLMSLSIVKALENNPVSVNIDLKPALTHGLLEKRLQRDFEQNGRKTFRNIMKGLLPSKMIHPVINLTNISPEKEGHELTASERKTVAITLKSLKFSIEEPISMNAAIVTSGGVDLKEIEPSTMASRLIEGLYFCGEVLDLDANTGGYNLQAAFSTGWLAGQAAAEYCERALLK